MTIKCKSTSKFLTISTFSGLALVGLTAASLTTSGVEAQAALSQQSTEAQFTPIALSPSTQFASLGQPQIQAQMASPLPKFDMNDAAGRYVALVQEADRMANLPNLSSLEIARALATTSQVSGKGISEGAGAYASEIAATQSEFAGGLRTTVNLLGREAVLERLRDNPDQFLAMVAGAQQASRAAGGALAASSAKLARAQEVLGQAAYSVQAQSWSQQEVDTPAALAAHRHAATLPITRSQAPLTNFAALPSEGPVNGRFLLAASYKILGEDEKAAQILDRPIGRQCIQLNVRQCLAASQYPYEHLFCLSKHSFGEASACVSQATK
jgi:hypothetical protein